MTPPTTRGDGTRRLILDAAEHQFLTRGYAGARVEHVAAQAHVSVGTIYLHYRNKEGLYAAVIVRAEEVLLHEYLAPTFELALPPWDRIRAWCRAYLRFVVDHADRARLLAVMEWWEAERPPDLDKRLRSDIRASEERFVGIFQEAADLGQLSGVDPTQASRFVWASMYGLCALNLRHADFQLDAEALEQIAESGLQLLSAPPPGAGQIDA